MINNDISTKEKILHASYNNFLLFGYRGTTLQRIAIQADVNRSVVHYYFRSKKRLYLKVVEMVLDLVFNTRFENVTDRKDIEKPTWFLFSEFYNNKSLFEGTLKEIYPNDWNDKFDSLLQWLELTQISSSIFEDSRVEAKKLLNSV
ncbi:MAG: TetR/AcrR family transcriptional regulator [Bacteroidales bacterium]|nr:TetR/AcrR family transcriptional regulator [Bacteroidales bacterium]